MTASSQIEGAVSALGKVSEEEMTYHYDRVDVGRDEDKQLLHSLQSHPVSAVTINALKTVMQGNWMVDGLELSMVMTLKYYLVVLHFRTIR